MLTRRKRDPLFKWQKNIQPAKLLGVIYGVNAFEMKNRLAAVILAEPAVFQRRPTRLQFPSGVADENFLQLRQPLRKIRKQFRGNLAFISARPQNVRNNNPAWSFRIQE